jgi:hypothetical protein
MRKNERGFQVIGVAVLLGLLAGLVFALAPDQPGVLSSGGETSQGRKTYYVSSSGSDSADGRAPDVPFATIQHAVDLAQPGDIVELAAGTYMQDVVSKRDGTAAAPITIRGPAEAVLKGGGATRVFEIHHDYLTLEGFTLDGLWGDPGRQEGYREKLLYVVGAQPHDGVTGLKVLGMAFKNAGGECLRLRYFARRNEIAHSTFVGCGVHDFKFDAGKRNGEALYVGTAPEQRANGENPTADVDESNDNWIHDNSFDTQGNECIDIKEGASGNVVEHNRCTGQRDPNSGGLDARGSGNIFRYNESFGNAGAGIRLGGDTAADGVDNQVYGNTFYGNGAGGIKLVRGPQQLCGNVVRDNPGGQVVGVGRERVDPAAPCAREQPSGPPPGVQTSPNSTPAAKPSPTPGLNQGGTPTSQAGEHDITPVLDTFVNSDSPERGYAKADRLKIDRTPETWALLRFELPGVHPSGRALLRLYPQASVKKGGTVHVVPADWNAGVTWESRPELGEQLGELGRVKKGDWVEIDVTSALRNGVVALAIVPQSEQATSYYASEDGTEHAPRLVLR